jgi:S-adenosylmethionine:tRNA ribosyltransferase-isomerase
VAIGVKKSELDYDLPEGLIAQEPCGQREQCRLMVLDRSSRTIDHRVFAELPGMLRGGDVLVLNHSKVVPARFEARRGSGGKVGGLFVREVGVGSWEVLLRSKGRLGVGDELGLGDGGRVMKLLERRQRGMWYVEVWPAETAERVLGEIGQVPLPPYIRRSRDDARGVQDREWYQTVYAREPGSVAAPTAGLHFSEGLLREVRQAGVELAYVTLHVGLGTFQPIEATDLADHAMHAESYELPAETAEAVNRARAGGGRVIAVGTTSVRVLETCSDEQGRVRPGAGTTSIFIYPPYQLRRVDGLITNFHLPGSTLLALVFAVADRDFVVRAYEEAVGRQYRFFSYGDAMMIV